MSDQETATPFPNRHGVCPTCGQETDFKFLGEQRWPAKLVEMKGIPAVTLLWTCCACHTTLSEPEVNL
jgi:hypothetical protein